MQANGGKYQLQNEKTQQSLEKAQSEFDRLQEKFERLTNDSRRVSHSYHYHNTDRHSFTLTCSNVKAQNMRAMYTTEMYCLSFGRKSSLWRLFFSHSILIARVLVFYTGFFILLFIWKDIRPFSMNCDPRTINPPTSKKKGSCIENTWSKIEFLREKKGKAALTQNLTSHTNSMINLAQCDWKEQIYLKDHNFDLALNL